MNRAPDEEDIKKSNNLHIGDYYYYFGSLDKALKKLEIKKYTIKELLNYLRLLNVSLGRNLTIEDLKINRKDIPSLETYQYYYPRFTNREWFKLEEHFNLLLRDAEIKDDKPIKKDIYINNYPEKKDKITIIGSYIDEFLRCSYRLNKSINENVKPMSFLSSEYIKNYIIQPGIDFEKVVLSKFDWKETDLPIEELIRKKVIIQKPRITIYKREEVKKVFDYIKEEVKNYSIDEFSSNCSLVGEPDIIVPKSNYYVPIDIKHHKDVNKMDKLRITFYALMLKSKFNYNILPEGFILLKNEKIIEVDTNKHVEEVLSILLKIHSNLNSSHLEPYLCSECSTCKLKEDCIAYIKKKKGLTLVHQVGRANEIRLKGYGINIIDDLAKLHPKEIKHITLNSFYGNKTHEIICASARAIHESREVRFGFDKLPENITEFFIDLEYSDKVFCHGIAIRKNNKILYKTFFDDEKGFDNFINIFMKKEKNIIFYTYAGESADLPFFKEKSYFSLISNRHIDIYKFLCKNIALPIQSYSEKEVALYFDIDMENNTKIKDGFEYLIAYSKYCNSKGKEKEIIKKQIMDYNKSDLLGLIKLKDVIKTKMTNLPLEYINL